MRPVRPLTEDEITEWYEAIETCRRQPGLRCAVRPRKTRWRQIRLRQYTTMIVDVWWRRDGFRI